MNKKKMKMKEIPKGSSDGETNAYLKFFLFILHFVFVFLQHQRRKHQLKMRMRRSTRKMSVKKWQAIERNEVLDDDDEKNEENDDDDDDAGKM